MNANEDVPHVVEQPVCSRRIWEGHNEAGIVLPPVRTVPAEPEPAEGGLETAEGNIGSPSM